MRKRSRKWQAFVRVLKSGSCDRLVSLLLGICLLGIPLIPAMLVPYFRDFKPDASIGPISLGVITYVVSVIVLPMGIWVFINVWEFYEKLRKELDFAMQSELSRIEQEEKTKNGLQKAMERL